MTYFDALKLSVNAPTAAKILELFCIFNGNDDDVVAHEWLVSHVNRYFSPVVCVRRIVKLTPRSC